MENFKTYKFCKDFGGKGSIVDHWAGGLGRVGVENGRPIIQSEEEIIDAPEYASQRMILKEDFNEDDSGWSPEVYDFKYEFLMGYPGMIILTKSSRISWNDLLSTLPPIEKEEKV